MRAPRLWSRRGPAALALSPLALLFYGVSTLRRAAYRRGWIGAYRAPVPVIVVGNLDSGGSGKTPLTGALIERLRARGLAPGVVSRGYGGSASRAGSALLVDADSDPAVVGDEPLLLARRWSVPVCVAADRARAVTTLLAARRCDVIVADDGLQHYRLRRDLELCVIDAARGLGNRWCLPAGPLREAPARLREVDLVLYRVIGNADVPPAVTVGSARSDTATFRLAADAAVSLADPARRCALSGFRGRRVHAVAGIGRPDGFFTLLRAAGIEPIEHRFADHYRFRPDHLDFGDTLPLLMTEKDAVKCTGRGREAFRAVRERGWYVPVDARLDATAERRLRTRLDALTGVSALADDVADEPTP